MNGAEHKVKTWYLMVGAVHRRETWYLMNGAEHKVKTWYLMVSAELRSGPNGWCRAQKKSEDLVPKGWY